MSNSAGQQYLKSYGVYMDNSDVLVKSLSKKYELVSNDNTTPLGKLTFNVDVIDVDIAGPYVEHTECYSILFGAKLEMYKESTYKNGLGNWFTCTDPKTRINYLKINAEISNSTSSDFVYSMSHNDSDESGMCFIMEYGKGNYWKNGTDVNFVETAMYYDAEKYYYNLIGDLSVYSHYCYVSSNYNFASNTIKVENKYKYDNLTGYINGDSNRPINQDYFGILNSNDTKSQRETYMYGAIALKERDVNRKLTFKLAIEMPVGSGEIGDGYIYENTFTETFNLVI